MHNKLQVFLSVICGVLPAARLNVRRNKIVSYMNMYIVPLLYLICFGLVRFGPLRLKKIGTCAKLCNLANVFFEYMGLCMYLWQHSYTLRRTKKFFIDFEISTAHIDFSLYKCRKRLDYEFKRESKTHWYYIAWLVLFLSFAGVMYFEVRELFYLYKDDFLFGLMSSCFPYFASSCLMGQFHYYVAEIFKRFRKLNELLELINSEIEDTYVPVMGLDIKTEEKKLDFKINHKANRDVLDDVSDRDGFVARRIPSESVLTDLFKIQDRIFALNVLVNGEYGVQVAPFMTVSFIISNLGLFMWSKIYVQVVGKNRILDYVVLLYINWTLAASVVAFLVLRVCHKCHDSYMQAPHIIHKMMIKRPAFMMGNDGYYNKMKAFALQFLHWNEYFQFNAIGLYTLDFGFIFTCFTASTTYLVVLFQFDLNPFLKDEVLV